MVLPSTLRALFKARLMHGENNSTGDFTPEDLERIENDQYLLRVLDHCKNDLEKSSKLLWNIMKWRKLVGASDICEDSIRMDYVLEGTMFCHGRDVDGCRLVILKVRTHIKGQKDFEEVKRIVMYWMDRLEREEDGNKVTLFFDMDGCGLQNMDIEFIKYLISVFYYYPSFLHRIIVFQLPWILTAAFKLVKSLLPPEAVALLKFVNRSNLKEVVRPDQALLEWGGTNNYVFKFVPEKTPKKVTFSSTISLNNIDSADNVVPTRYSKIDAQESIISSANFTIVNASDTAINANSDEIIIIEPRDKLLFKYENEELAAQIKITNMADKRVAFKIRTTSPEKFWVRPTSGILEPIREKTHNKVNCAQTVDITVIPYNWKSVTREKFLVMAAEVNSDLNQRDFKELWKDSSKIEEFRLRCQVFDNIENDKHVNNVKVHENNISCAPDVSETKRILEECEEIRQIMNDLKNDVTMLRQDITQFKLYNTVTLGLIFILALFLYMNRNINKEL